MCTYLNGHVGHEGAIHGSKGVETQILAVSHEASHVVPAARRTENNHGGIRAGTILNYV